MSAVQVSTVGSADGAGQVPDPPAEEPAKKKRRLLHACIL